MVRREYLDEFVPTGGAAVKFAVPAGEAGRDALVEGLRDAARAAGFQFALVDAVSTRLHLVDKLFHAVAQQVDWDALARTFVVRVLAQRGLRLPGPDEAFSLAGIAGLNDYPEPLLRTEVARWLTNAIFHDYAMSREFRLAMIQLCLAQLDPGADPALADAVRAWLRGELRLLSGVKRALIFQQVARHNARHLLFSLAHWLRLAGRSGLLLTLDIARFLDAARPAQREQGFYYSTAAALDGYEVLRQLVDGTDELAHGFVCVVAPPDFLRDDRRGLRGYQALYFRVWDEVHDRFRQNPLSSLVRLDGASAPGAPDGPDARAAVGARAGW